jgi:uncharacterized alpha-E superfamily protein
MLSRVADSLFWMSRNVERAENIARIVDINLQLMLDIPSRQTVELAKNWMPIVACLGEEEAFQERHKKSDLATVTEFLLFDRAHANSIASCLSSARENARTVREILSSEMWEQINRTSLWIQSKAARQSFENNQYEFFQRVKKTLQLFQGITDTTMIHGEGWEFIQLGKFLERADKTSRVLDEKYHILNQKSGTSPNDLLLQWLAVLRSCSARQTYQRIYACAVDPIKVAEFLILNETLPRSIIFSVLHLDQSLRRISGVAAGHYANPAEKHSGRLLAELTFSSIEEYWQQGLHQAVDTIQLKLNQIGQGIFDSYIHQSFPEPANARTTAQPAQE